ncbi:hypothetical protein GLOIN_2v1474682 [Rhizophagus irregularis DAOM 181602=DAOM 197198]|nr:hypothetical protein GLOIN_2v1474682 [Rhizophagus irregularis DAOM 181602=DAOM 197198]
MPRASFNKDIDAIIVNTMKIFHHRSDCFDIISKKIPDRNKRQIIFRWRNTLDPRLCGDSLTLQEKNFIDNEIFVYLNCNKIINWRKIIENVERHFGRRHGDRKLKYYWFKVKKYQREITGVSKEPMFAPTFNNNPFKMHPIF